MKLVIDKICKDFTNNRGQALSVLQDIELTVNEEEFVALVGPSGCGKSTLLNIASGLLQPTSGTVKFTEVEEGYEPRMSIVFQETGLFPWRNVHDNIAFGLETAGMPATQREERIEHYIELVGLKGFEKSFPHQLSGGMRQRVGIARALIMNPKLIIADECISALDVSIQAQVVNLMKDIQQETGTAYLFIAHDLSMVKYISDRIGVLHLGHLLETGTTEEIFADPIHPYTRSLLSAIPLPNPVVEKRRVAETYDYATSGIDYSKGTSHLVSGSHYVKCTDEEFAKWCK